MRRAKLARWWPSQSAPVALHLAANFCAEHENGIATLSREFGLPELSEANVGIDRHKIRILPPDLIWFHKPRSRYAFLRFQAFAFGEPTVKGRETWIGRKEDTAGAWDSGSFQVVAQTPTSRKNLADLRDAFADLDVCILLGGEADNPFSRPGLTLGIVSRTPPEIIEQLREHDLDMLALRAAAKATGIRERFRAAGIHAYSFVPRWAPQDKGAVEWYLWLPDHFGLQGGWYSTDELERWLDRFLGSAASQVH